MNTPIRDETVIVLNKQQIFYEILVLLLELKFIRPVVEIRIFLNSRIRKMKILKFFKRLSEIDGTG